MRVYALLIFVALAARRGFPQEGVAAPRFTGSFQTALAETFQLTLGGTFGEGPAWQNKASFAVNRITSQHDSVQMFGFNISDTREPTVNMQAGVAYRRVLLDRGGHGLAGWIGYQHWQFDSVFTGTNDHLIAANLTYQTYVRGIPVTVAADSWRLVSSPYRLGTILYPQACTTHTLWTYENLRLVLHPAVATTYSWHFWNRDGLRVFRYGATLALEGHAFTLEGTVRRQVALQRGIPENTYYLVGFTRFF